jgi:hypothetical protein
VLLFDLEHLSLLLARFGVGLQTTAHGSIIR